MGFGRESPKFFKVGGVNRLAILLFLALGVGSSDSCVKSEVCFTFVGC